MTNITDFQGVVCCCLDTERSSHDTIFKLLEIEPTDATSQYIDLLLSNKYYKATVHLFEFKKNDDVNQEILKDCHAVILYMNGIRNTIQDLDDICKLLSCVVGEPRILLCDNIDEDCQAYSTIQNWSIEHNYDFLLMSEEDLKKQVIDCLSAYRWIHRTDVGPNVGNHTCQQSVTNGESSKQASSQKISGNVQNSTNDTRQLDGELMKKLIDFDSLLNKLSVYRDNRELRGNPDDKNIVEIAEILSGLLGDDVDEFLEEQDISSANDRQIDSSQ